LRASSFLLYAFLIQVYMPRIVRYRPIV